MPGYPIQDSAFVEFVPGAARRAPRSSRQEKMQVPVELSLRDSEQQFRALADNAPLLMWVSGSSGCEFVNRAFLKFVGLKSEAEMHGERWVQFLHERDRAAYLEAYQDCIAKHVAFHAQCRWRQHNGVYRWMKTVGQPRFNASGSFRGYLGSAVDITELKELEETLRRQAGLLQLSHDAILVWRLGGGIEFWNEGAVELYGYEPHEAIGLMPQDLLKPIHARPWPQIEAELASHGFWQGELRQRTRHGREVFVSSRLQLVPNSGEAPLVFETNRDITESKRLQQELLEISEREQSRIGQDLHDGLCQQLAGIEFRLLGLQQKSEGKSRALAAELARLVREAIEQTRNLAHGLSPVMMSGDGLMNGLQKLALNTGTTFDLSCTFLCPEPVPVPESTVATHLYRISQEAVHNALRHGRAKTITIELSLNAGQVVLAVRDDGVGLQAGAEGANGMGLRVMRYRAQIIGGTLMVQGEPRGGTSVICSVPQSAVAEAQPEKSPPQ